MMKVVLKVDLYDDRIKLKAMKTASGLSGVESVSIDINNKKLTLTGDIDSVHAVRKLRKWCHTEIISVGPVKEENKNGESKPKAHEPITFYEAYPLYYEMRPPLYNQYRYVVQEDPAGCVIC